MSTLVVDRDLNGVPKPIVEKLRSVVKRARTVLLVRGIMAVFSVALLALLVGMAIDSSFTIFSTALRAAISLSLLSVVLASVYFFLIRPLMRTFDLTGVARIIETRHPELEERISSAVELLTSKDISEIRGSEALIAEVAKQAVGQVGSVSPQKEFSFAIARPYFIAAGLFTLILLLLFVLSPTATSRLFNRVVAPFANIGNVQSTDIVVVPGDQVIAEGDSLRIEVTVPNDRVETARLRRQSGGSPETAERMKSLSADENGNPRFFLSIPAVSEDFQYRVHAGGALSRYYSVKVVPRPVVEQFEVVYQYPSYMSRADRTVTSESGNIEGPVGSLVTIVAKTNTKIKSAHMTIAGMPAHEATIRTDEGVSYCEWQIPLTDDLIIGRTWTLRLQDENNFMNWPTEYTIKAVPDKSPTIVILEPVDRRLRMKATDSLPIHYRAEDDVEVAKTELVASVDGRDEIARSLAIPRDADRTSFNSITQLELSAFAGKGAQTIKVQLRVSDSLPNKLQGPHLAVSDVITITLDETADTYFEKRAAKDYASLREALQRVLVELQQADQQATDLDKAVMPEGRLAEQVSERIDQVRELANQAEQDLRDLSEVLPSTSFVSLQPEVDDLADTDVTSARDQAGLIKLSDTTTQRTEHALASDKHVEQAIARTEELIKDLDGLWEQIQRIADLQDLADRQEAIAEQIANVKLENFPELPITEQQLQVAQEIAETIKATPQVLQDLLQEKHQQAEDLVKAAEELAEQQTELAQVTETSNQPNVDLEELREQIAQAIAQEQEQIAEEAAALDQEIENADQAGEDQQSNLTDKPAETATEIAQGDLSEAIDDAEVAAEQFEQAAAALENNQPVPDGASAEDENGQPENGQPENAKPQEGQPEKGQPENGQPEGQPEGGQPEKGQPEKGQPENGQPEGQPEGGQPEKGQPEKGQPENGQPEGQPEGGQPEKGQPEKGQPENGQPEGQPEGGQPEKGQPEKGQPENGQPEGQPEGGQPEKGQPEKGQPENGNPDGQPEGGQPQEGQPEGGQPENGQPQEGQPENGQPQRGDPEQNAQLAQKAAELAQRQEKVAEQLKALNEGDLDNALEMIQQQVAQDAAELAETVESVAQLLEVLDQPQEAKASAQQATAELERAAAQAQQAQDQIAQAQADANPQGEPQNGEPAEGQPENGQPQEGQPAEGQPAEGQPAEGQPAEGQPQGGEPAESQPENGQPAGQGEGEPESGEPTAATGQPAKQQAVQAQQQAAQALENAARALENLANNLETQAAALEGEALASLSPTEAASGELGDALESAAEAIAALQSNPAENPSAQAATAQAESAQAQAAQSSEKAAQALGEAAQAAAEQAGVPTEPNAAESGQQPSQGEPGEPQNGEPQNNQPSPSSQQGQNGQSQQPSSQRSQGTSDQGLRGGTMDNELEQKLKEYGISSAQWTRLPGSLKNQIRQAEAEGVPEEYRAMVRRYFRELARRSSDEQNANKN